MPLVNGFPVRQYGDRGLGSFMVPDTAVQLSLARDVAPILLGFARDFHQTVEPLKPGWCWGHSPKHIPGSDVWSNHAWGGAIDLNAPMHPMGRRGTFSAGEIKAIRRLLAKYRHGGYALIRWGGDFTTRADDMHFELVAPRSVLLAAVKALQAPPKPKPTRPAPAGTHRPGSRTLRRTDPPMTGADVEFVQEFIGASHCGPADGAYGRKTEGGVRWYRRMRGLRDGGDVDAVVWSNMGVR